MPTNAPPPMAIRDELVREHIPYEIAMMRRTLEMVGTGILAGILKNAVIESFALHCRALIEFFLGKSGSSAKHFTDSTYIPFKHKPYLPIEKLNQQIAHITEKRVTHAHLKLNGADMMQLRKDLDIEVAEFVSHLTAHYKSEWDIHRQL